MRGGTASANWTRVVEREGGVQAHAVFTVNKKGFGGTVLCGGSFCGTGYYLCQVLLVACSGDVMLTSWDRSEGVYCEFRLSAGRT